MQHTGKADIEARKLSCESRWAAVQELAKTRRTTLEASQELQQFFRDVDNESKYLAYRLKALESTDYAKVCGAGGEARGTVWGPPGVSRVPLRHHCEYAIGLDVAHRTLSRRKS